MYGSIYFIDTFTTVPFRGNPTAVCLVDDSFSAEKMLLVAAELNLPVTAFVMNRTAPENSYTIRYFTTITEIPACGHATLAAARVLYERGAGEMVFLHTISGIVIEAAYKNDIVLLKYPVYS
jgi:PhzF family phenazine biosynthesis protein